MPAPDPMTQLELQAVLARYAKGLDRRDRQLFLSAFHTDCRLRIHSPATDPTPVSDRRGHGELADVTDVIGRYAQTFHFLGQSAFQVDGDEATGETHCLAHHLTVGPHGGENLVMHIRYDERLRRGDDGEWRFVDRGVMIDWMDRRLAVPLGGLPR